MRLGRHIGVRQFRTGLPLPVRVDPPQGLLRLFRYIEGIRLAGFHGVKLRLQPLPRKLRIGLAAARRQRRGTDDQLSPADDDGQAFEDMGERQGAPQYLRLSFRGAVAFGDEDGAGRLDLRHFGEQIGHQAGDALGFRLDGGIKRAHPVSFPQ